VRGRDADQTTLDGICQDLGVLGQNMVGAYVRQDITEDVTEFDVTQVTLFDSLTTDAVSRLTQQIRLYIPACAINASDINHHHVATR